jgi:DNA-binding response OmpR family regulator
MTQPHHRDNEDLVRLRTALENEDFVVTIVGNGAAGLEEAKRGDVDLIILDLMLPGMDGIASFVCCVLPTSTPGAVLTAKGEEANKVQPSTR